MLAEPQSPPPKKNKNFMRYLMSHFCYAMQRLWFLVILEQHGKHISSTVNYFCILINQSFYTVSPNFI